MRAYTLFALIAALLISCEGCREKKQYQQTDPQQIQEDLIQARRQVVLEEHADIEAYIREKGWSMTKTSTGIYYEIYEHGAGDSVRFNSIVSLDFVSQLIDDTPLYSSDIDGPKVFSVGQSEAESGLHEVVLHMREGDKAHVVLPSHFAYGFTGDLDRIPPNSILVYDLTLSKVQ